MGGELSSDAAKISLSMKLFQINHHCLDFRGQNP
jgi:hypothetical protein